MVASVDIAGNRRCSVYLNNVGCALMKQGSFQDAMKTFSDAVFVMKHGVVCSSYPSTTPPTTQEGPAVVVVPCLDLQAKMQRSDQRLAFHQASSRSKDKAYFPTESFEFIELDDYLQIEIDDLLCKEEEEEPTVVLLCPIRIDADLTNSTSGSSMELLSGTMLYNLGLSHMCLAKVDPTFDALCQEYRGAAIVFFQMADCILHRLLIANPKDVVDQDYELGKITAMTDMAVIHSLYQVMADRPGSDETILTAAQDEVCLWLSFLQDCIYMNDWTYLGGLPPATTAAVA